jgi:hypothetical protein
MIDLDTHCSISWAYQHTNTECTSRPLAMDKFLARFKPYNKKGRKDNTSSTSAVGGTSGSSQSARRDKTSSSTAVSGSLADNQNVGSSQSKSAAPRIDLDFKIPGERTVLDPPAQVIAEHEQGESRSARILSSLEKKAVSKRRFTAGEALVAWQVSGNDLKAIGTSFPCLWLHSWLKPNLYVH